MGAELPRLKSIYDQVGGLRIHARVAAGPGAAGRLPVVLVHGLSVSSRYMVPTARRLACDFPVYAPDLPGYGHSQKPGEILDVPQLAAALLDWLDTAGLDRVSMLGNSMGCQVIVDFALRFPRRIDRAVLTGPTIDSRARSSLREILRGLRNMRYEPLSLTPILVRDYLYAGPRRTFATLSDAEQDPIRQKLKRVPVPVLVVRGQHDRIVPQDWAEEVTRLLPDGRLVVIPGAAHAVIYDAAPRLAPMVKEFLLA